MQLKFSCVFDRLAITWEEDRYRRLEIIPGGDIEGLLSAERSGATLFTRGEYIGRKNENFEQHPAGKRRNANKIDLTPKRYGFRHALPVLCGSPDCVALTTEK